MSETNFGELVKNLSVGTLGVANYYADVGGLPKSTVLGMRYQTEAARISGQANWTGIDTPGDFKESVTYNPPPGWIIMESKLVIMTNVNGGAGLSQLAAGLNLVSRKTLEDTYDQEIEASVKDGDKGYEGHLRERKKRHIKELIEASTNRNTLILTAQCSGHGTAVDRKGGAIDAHADVTLEYIGHEDVDSLKRSMKLAYTIERL